MDIEGTAGLILDYKPDLGNQIEITVVADNKETFFFT